MDHQKIYNSLNRFLSQSKLRNLYLNVRKEFREQDAIGHNWDHVRRDILNAVYIGNKENADMDIVMPAIILHDIGYVTHSNDPFNHPLNGSRECIRFLDDWTQEQRRHISSCILKHKGKFPGFEYSEPETPEEKVVCDADQIDKFGWIGFLQMITVYVEYAEHGNKQYKSLKGIAKAMNKKGSICMYTETGKQLAAARTEPDFASIAIKMEEDLDFYEDWKEDF